MKKCSDMANIIKESLPQLLSPNAAELGRYGKNPVNYFNGLPGIVVPLTSVHAKGYESSDGTTRSFKACTYPADPELFATVPEGIYEAHFGKHHGQYDALKMRDVDAKNQTIELGTTNPAYKDGRTYAAGINIHMAGGRNLTGKDSQGRYVSKGCLLIDRDEWENFMELFDKAILKTSPASITVSRSLAFPVNTDED